MTRKGSSMVLAMVLLVAIAGAVLLIKTPSLSGALIFTSEAAAPNGCNNGYDDDFDGTVDLTDSDCYTYLVEDCKNKIDDDYDGLIDKRDPDCRKSKR